MKFNNPDYIRYKEIQKLLISNLNFDISEIIINYLKLYESKIVCIICKKKKLRKEMNDVEYLCSPLCGYCGICINNSEICFSCSNSEN